MFQIQLDCTSETAFRAALSELETELKQRAWSAALFHVFNASPDRVATDGICAELKARFPEVPYVCITTSGNIVNGVYLPEKTLNIVCSVFEEPDAKIKVLQLSLNYASQHASVNTLLQYVKDNPWVKAVEMLVTLNDVNMVALANGLSTLPTSVTCFGGGALNHGTDFVNAFVSSSNGNSTNTGVVFVLYGGENFHVFSAAIHGWRSLGMPFNITRAQESTIYELDGKPAYDVYNHYLSIPEDDDFSRNGLLFPLAINHKGVEILRTPTLVNSDGSLVVPSDISTDDHKCRIAYGDPATILRRVEQTAKELQALRPQGILCFSCAARQTYWGNDYISRETQVFQAIAPTTGFFSGSEFIRNDKMVVHHNVTLVLVAMREGPAEDQDTNMEPIEVDKSEFNLQLSIINRMASFIGAASDELQEAYKSMETMARTDGLTGLANRREAERIIEKALNGQRGSKTDSPSNDEDHAQQAGLPALFMLDLDNFKQVNDQFGHAVGDDVLRALSDLLRRFERDCGTEFHGGRWGGEEFVAVLPSASLNEAEAIAEKLRNDFAKIEHPEAGRHTMSIGIAKAKPGEALDSLCSRADAALYQAKDAGKNRVILADAS